VRNTPLVVQYVIGLFRRLTNLVVGQGGSVEKNDENFLLILFF